METKGERGVYRRNVGIFMLIAGTIVGAMSGLSFYVIDSMIVWAILGTGATLLGVGNVTDIWKQTTKTK